MTERRYSEEEVAAIFARASETQQPGHRQLPPGDGLTLRDLQDIGREVGIPSALVARAAQSLEHAGAPTRRTFLGLPIGVGHSTPLERPLTDQEWEHLVVDLRQTFDARGTIRQEGSLRSWTNGNLQALLEPTPAGQRLRLRTLKGNARALMAVGLGSLGAAAASVVAVGLAGGLTDPGALAGAGLLTAVGLGLFGFGAVQLPSWARRRRRQMEEVSARLAQAVASGPPPFPPADRE